mmetsp:Transcript_79801/g.119936  ORF Transcript_79801/g.119936 Transcript_79801/m.119936 type:complete len:258 (-) Transcript_79801:1-774(-)
MTRRRMDRTHDGTVMFMRQDTQQLHNLIGRTTIQSRRRLVQEQDRRSRNQRQSNVDPLGLSTRYPTHQRTPNHGRSTRFQIQHLNHLFDAGVALCGRQIGRQFQLGRILQHVFDRQFADQRVELFDVTNRKAMITQRRFGAIVQDLTVDVTGILSSGEGVQQCRLATAGRAHQGGQLSRNEASVQSFENGKGRGGLIVLFVVVANNRNGIGQVFKGNGNGNFRKGRLGVGCCGCGGGGCIGCVCGSVVCWRAHDEHV